MSNPGAGVALLWGRDENLSAFLSCHFIRANCGLVIFAGGGVAEQGGDEAGGRDQLCQIDSGGNAKTVEHVDKVFGGEVARRTGGVGAATKTARRRVDDADAHLQRGKDVGKGGAACVVEVDGQLFDGNRALAGQQVKHLYHLVGRGDADGIAEREFVDAHCQQGLCHVEDLPGGDMALVGTAEDGGNIAAHGDTFLLCQRDDGTKVGKAFFNGGVDVVTGEALAGSGKYGDG